MMDGTSVGVRTTEHRTKIYRRAFILALKAKHSTRCDTKSHRKELNLRVQFTEPMPGHLMHRATDLEAI